VAILHNVYSTLVKLYRAKRLFQVRRELGGRDRITFRLQCGYDIELRLNDQIAERLLFTGRFEPEVSTALFSLVRPGMTVLDIGANIGLHTLHLAKLVGKQGCVLAFEPNRVAYKELQNNVALNNLKNVLIFNFALWEQDGEELFYFPQHGMEAMGGLMENFRFRTAHKGMVQTARLDSVTHGLGVAKVDFIKIDVEGAELQVLLGAGAMLDAACRPAILYESTLKNSMAYSYTPEDILKFLNEREYTVEKIANDEYLALPYVSCPP
jgi:FkbM family methyltransferase